MLAAARSAGAHRRQGLRRGRRRLPVLPRRAGRRAGDPPGARRRGARACSISPSSRTACGSRAASPPERGGGQPRHRPRPGRNRRSPRDQGREPVQDPRVPQRRGDRRRISPSGSPDLTPAAAPRAFPASARTSPRRSASSSRPARLPITRSCSQEFPPRSSTCSISRASGRRPPRSSTASSASGRSTTSKRPITQGRLRGVKGMGEKKAGADPAGASSERAQVAGRRLMAEATRPPTPLAGGAPRARARRRHLGRRQPAPRLRNRRRPRHRRGRRAAVGDGCVHRLPLGRAGPGARRRRSRACCCAAASRRICGWCARESLGAARQYFTGSKAHNIALRDRALQRGFKLNEYGLFRAGRRRRGGGRGRGRHLSRARPGADPAGAAGEPRRDRSGRTAARCPASSTAADLRGDLHMHTTATDGRADIETMARAARDAGPPLHRHHRSQPGAGDGQRPRRAAPPWRTRRASAPSTSGSRASPCSPASSATSAPTARMDLADDCLAAARRRGRVRALGVQPGTGADDRSDPARAGLPVGGHPRPIRPAGCSEREGYRYDIERVFAAAAAARRRDRDQQPGRSPRSPRYAGAARARPRRHARSSTRTRTARRRSAISAGAWPSPGGRG